MFNNSPLPSSFFTDSPHLLQKFDTNYKLCPHFRQNWKLKSYFTCYPTMQAFNFKLWKLLSRLSSSNIYTPISQGQVSKPFCHQVEHNLGINLSIMANCNVITTVAQSDPMAIVRQKSFILNVIYPIMKKDSVLSTQPTLL